MAHGNGKLAAIDLFSGCGGLTLGLRQAGFQVLAAIEIDQKTAKIYRDNHSKVVVMETDIRNLSPHILMCGLDLRKGDLDLLAGCPPCQGFSALRTLNGSLRVDDPRNDLLSAFEKYVQAFKPKAVMMENVPGLAREDRFEYFCTKMHDIGYNGQHKVLDASDYGVPQRRRRLIYLAGYKTVIPFAPKTGKLRTVRDALLHLPDAGNSGDAIHDIPENRSSRVMRIIQSIPKDGGSRTALPKTLQLDCHKRCNGFRDVYGRMAWDEVAPTITSGCFNPSKGRFLHPDEHRAITIREAAILQGFPSTYRFDPQTGKEALAAMIGNALPPPFVAAHGHSVSKVLRIPGRHSESH